MIKVYIAGPYTKGDMAMNVRAAIDAGNLLLNAGYAPYIPHLTHFVHMIHPHKYEEWLALDNEFLPVCNALLRLEGESSGADLEVALAQRIGVPVFFSMEKLFDHFSKDEEIPF